MNFDYDPEKSASNKQKHGIDFEEAQGLWSDPYAFAAPARTVDEPREIVIGLIGDKLWAAVVTYRDDVIRIISVRRARKEETEAYERQIREDD